MTTKETLLLVFALIWMVLVVFVLAYWMKKPVVVSAIKKDEFIEVLVAATNIKAGTPLTDVDVSWKAIPGAQVQADDIKRGVHYVGRPVLISLQKSQLIKSNYLAPLQATRMSQLISAGNYAMTVNMDKNQDENMFIMPGDKVDVLLTRSLTNKDPSYPSTEFVTQRILTKVRVLAVDNVKIQDTSLAVKTPALTQKTLTLEVNAKQAEYLALGSSMGRLSFSLHTASGVNGDTSSVSSVFSKSLDPPRSPPVIEYHGAKMIVK